MARKSVQISIDDELLQKIDDYANSLFISRSSFFAMTSSQFLFAEDFKKMMGQMSATFKRIADNGNFTDDDIKELGKYEEFFNILAGQNLIK